MMTLFKNLDLYGGVHTEKWLIQSDSVKLIVSPENTATSTLRVLADMYIHTYVTHIFLIAILEFK